MALAKPEKKYWSRQEIVADPKSPESYEVLEGELYLPPSPGFSHQKVVSKLLAVLIQHVTDKDLGEVVVAPLDVVISRDESLQPDIIYVSKDRRDIIKNYVEGPPDLVVEVVSPFSSSRDRVTKARVYARFGVPNYWIIDPADKSLLAYHLQDKNYVLISTAVDAEEFVPALFPELIIKLAELWE